MHPFPFREVWCCDFEFSAVDGERPAVRCLVAKEYRTGKTIRLWLDGQTAPVHSVSAGLDYPGVGPEHSYWKDSGRVRYTSVDDAAALEGFRLCARLEGILPALETAHAVVEAMRVAAKRAKEDIVVVCFSGRGDKDCFEVARVLGEELD